MSNPYWKNICALAEKQREKGMKTYGYGIEDNPADIIKRIEYLQEELVDGLMYCEWIKDRITGDAVEVVHGRWIEKYDKVSWHEDDVERFFECSICGCISGYDSPYCSNCGAQMDGDGNA